MRRLLPVVVLSIVAAAAGPVAAQAPNVSPALADEIACEAYIWGYPLVLMDATRHVLTNHEVVSDEHGLAPINQIAQAKTFPFADFHTVVRPNFDTLDSTAWLDLGAEPMVITMPKTDRYHVFELMDAWSDVVAALGTHMTGGTYLIVGSRSREEIELAASAGRRLLADPALSFTGGGNHFRRLDAAGDGGEVGGC